MATLGQRISNFFSGDDNDTREGLHGLFVTEIKNIYYAEKQAVDALGVQADAATTDEVRSAFLQHQEESRQQVARLEQVFQSIGVDAEEGTCEAIDGLAEDAEMVVSMTQSDSLTRDAGLIAAAQKVEHHEIASYGSAATFAKALGYTEAARLLEQTLEEEKNTDRKLTQLAESFINQQAVAESGDMGNNQYGNSGSMSSGSTGQTYQSGSSYSGSMGSGSASSGSGYGSGSGSSGSGSGYSSSNDATLGGTLVILCCR